MIAVCQWNFWSVKLLVTTHQVTQSHIFLRRPGPFPSWMKSRWAAWEAASWDPRPVKHLEKRRGNCFNIREFLWKRLCFHVFPVSWKCKNNEVRRLWDSQDEVKAWQNYSRVASATSGSDPWLPSLDSECMPPSKTLNAIPLDHPLISTGKGFMVTDGCRGPNNCFSWDFKWILTSLILFQTFLHHFFMKFVRPSGYWAAQRTKRCNAWGPAGSGGAFHPGKERNSSWRRHLPHELAGGEHTWNGFFWYLSFLLLMCFLGWLVSALLTAWFLSIVFVYEVFPRKCTCFPGAANFSAICPPKGDERVEFSKDLELGKAADGSSMDPPAL